MRAALNNIDSTGLDLFGNDMAPAVYKVGSGPLCLVTLCVHDASRHDH